MTLLNPQRLFKPKYEYELSLFKSAYFFFLIKKTESNFN